LEEEEGGGGILFLSFSLSLSLYLSISLPLSLPPLSLSLSLSFELKFPATTTISPPEGGKVAVFFTCDKSGFLESGNVIFACLKGILRMF
jgi:hypothetical protein